MAFLAALGTSVGGALGVTGAGAASAGFSAIGTMLSVVTTLASMSKQAEAQRLQSQQAELQGRQNALNYNRQANQIRERQLMLAATTRARASAGGVDPLTGSPLSIQQVDAMKAAQEAQIAQENAEIAVYGGLAQSQSLQAAASATQTIGWLQAGSTIAQGGSKIYDLRTPTRA